MLQFLFFSCKMSISNQWYFHLEEAKSCLDCTYSEAVVGGLFTKAGTYYCNARNKKIHMDDLACSRFRE